MIPKKHKKILEETQNKLNKQPDLIIDVINFYWENVRKTLTELKYNNVYVPELGTFSIKYWLLNKEIERVKNIMGAYENYDSFKEHHLYKIYSLDYERLCNMQKMVNKELEKKSTIKQKRNEKK